MNTNKTIYLIPISIILAGALIGAGIYLGSVKNIKNQQATNTAVNQENPAQPKEIKINQVTQDEHILGDAKAKVVMVEFSDLECPFCKVFHETLHKVLDKYSKNNDVAWVYRHFPLTELHPKAPKEAEASECAWEQKGNDGFWNFIDQVYKVTPSNNRLDPVELPKIAGKVGLDVNKFNECLSSGKFKDKVAAQRAEAIQAGGQGTPYTILVTSKGNIPITQGAISYEQLSSLIDQILADK